MAPPTVAAILCADWSKPSRKRAVYEADISSRTVRRVAGTKWSFARVLNEARQRSSAGSVLTTFDVPFGVPDSYFAAVSRAKLGRSPTTFLELLSQAPAMPSFFAGTAVASEWRIDRPFFSVPPKSKGGLQSYRDAAAEHGVDLYRVIDRLTGAKPIFAKSGIPGTVGSAAAALWQELAPQLRSHRVFKVWPFEGALEVLLRETHIVVGEIYPRVAYATALLDEPPESRPRLIVAKMDACVRRDAMAVMKGARWARELQVTFENVAEAEANDDDFDACLTAGALLRCILEGSLLCRSSLDSPFSEGGILGTGSVNLDLRQRTFATPRHRRRPTAATLYLEGMSIGAASAQTEAINSRSQMPVFCCPIAGCQKVFRGSRGGWDSHVGSLRLHPSWHPELESREERKRCFKAEFPEFFR